MFNFLIFCWTYKRGDDQNIESSHVSAILAQYEFSSVGHKNIDGSHMSWFNQWKHDISDNYDIYSINRQLRYLPNLHS